MCSCDEPVPLTMEIQGIKDPSPLGAPRPHNRTTVMEWHGVDASPKQTRDGLIETKTGTAARICISWAHRHFPTPGATRTRAGPEE